MTDLAGQDTAAEAKGRRSAAGGPLDRRLTGAGAAGGAGRAHLGITGALATVDSVLLVVQAALLADVISRAALQHTALSALRGSIVVLAAVLVVRGLLHGATELSGRTGAVRVMSTLRRRVARRLIVEAPESRPAGLRTGELATATVGGVDALESYFAGYLPQLVRAGIVPPIVLIAVAWRSPLLAGILAFTVPLLIIFMILVGKDTAERTRRRHGALALLSAHFLDVVSGLATLRAFRREEAQRTALETVGERYRAETIATLRLAFLSALVLELCATIGTALVAATIGVALCAGAMSLRTGLFVLLLAPELYGPLREVGRQYHAGADASAAADRIFAVLDHEPPEAQATAGVGLGDPVVAPDPARAPIVVRGLGFRHDPDRPPALDGLDLVLEPGCTTVLSGPSGAGKSTFARLLLGLARPDRGSIRCGEVELTTIPREAWWDRIAWLPQRPTLFEGTVAENLRLGAPEADDGALRRALAQAGAAELVEDLPDGLATAVGPGGRRLSAGQRQRIALARTFLRDAPLVVLDEPTAHLDPETAAALHGPLRALCAGRTALVITHDPALQALGDRRIALTAPPAAAAAEVMAA